MDLAYGQGDPFRSSQRPQEIPKRKLRKEVFGFLRSSHDSASSNSPDSNDVAAQPQKSAVRKFNDAPQRPASEYACSVADGSVHSMPLQRFNSQRSMESGTSRPIWGQKHPASWHGSVATWSPQRTRRPSVEESATSSTEFDQNEMRKPHARPVQYTAHRRGSQTAASEETLSIISGYRQGRTSSTGESSPASLPSHLGRSIFYNHLREDAVDSRTPQHRRYDRDENVADYASTPPLAPRSAIATISTSPSHLLTTKPRRRPRSSNTPSPEYHESDSVYHFHEDRSAPPPPELPSAAQTQDTTLVDPSGAHRLFDEEDLWRSETHRNAKQAQSVEEVLRRLSLLERRTSHYGFGEAPADPRTGAIEMDKEGHDENRYSGERERRIKRERERAAATAFQRQVVENDYEYQQQQHQFARQHHPPRSAATRSVATTTCTCCCHSDSDHSNSGIRDSPSGSENEVDVRPVLLERSHGKNGSRDKYDRHQKKPYARDDHYVPDPHVSKHQQAAYDRSNKPERVRNGRHSERKSSPYAQVAERRDVLHSHSEKRRTRRTHDHSHSSRHNHTRSRGGRNGPHAHHYVNNGRCSDSSSDSLGFSDSGDEDDDLSSLQSMDTMQTEETYRPHASRHHVARSSKMRSYDQRTSPHRRRESSRHSRRNDEHRYRSDSDSDANDYHDRSPPRSPHVDTYKRQERSHRRSHTERTDHRHPKRSNERRHSYVDDELPHSPQRHRSSRTSRFEPPHVDIDTPKSSSHTAKFSETRTSPIMSTNAIVEMIQKERRRQAENKRAEESTPKRVETDDDELHAAYEDETPVVDDDNAVDPSDTVAKAEGHTTQQREAVSAVTVAGKRRMPDLKVDVNFRSESAFVHEEVSTLADAVSIQSAESAREPTPQKTGGMSNIGSMQDLMAMLQSGSFFLEDGTVFLQHDDGSRMPLFALSEQD